MDNKIDPIFIKSGDRNIFVIKHGDLNKRATLVVPALFEEHNYSLSVLSNTLSSNGRFFVRFDYAGLGDSEGNILGTSIEDWLQNIVDVGKNMLEQGVDKISLLGIRFGGLLILANQEYLHQELPISDQTVWKPLVSGQAQINLLKKLKRASFSQNEKEGADWLAKVANGEVVNVGGYPISNELLTSLERLQINVADKPLSKLHWLELGSNSLPINVLKFSEHWNDVEFKALECERFWQIPEIYKAPQLERVHKELSSFVV